MIPQDLDKISRSMLREISEGKEAERSDFVMREKERARVGDPKTTFKSRRSRQAECRNFQQQTNLNDKSFSAEANAEKTARLFALAQSHLDQS